MNCNDLGGLLAVRDEEHDLVTLGGMSADVPSSSAPIRLTSAHRRRLREVWRSAGWPAQDLLEAELLAAGLLERHHDSAGRCTIRVTDAGIQALADSAARNRAARSAHEALVEQVALAMLREGRIAWRGLTLRARVPGESGGSAPVPMELSAHDASVDTGPSSDDRTWQLAMPDVFSVRHTSVAAYLQPLVHEIKVSRADLLADLRQPTKRAAYLDMAGGLYYVLAEGIARAEEIPAECGVIEMRGGLLHTLRPAPMRAPSQEAGLPFAVWMALARAVPVARPESLQLRLGDSLENTGPLTDDAAPGS
ncbi:hypothetical protein X805_21120 [Sphaerotilus natans subsp. natans DSM 6575]|uniref:Uncharacterized protein n=2 Tax=Sphaerotilus natans TaxID=34103 RepID=A0A059KLP1_9BURK|nr:hypothetical protein X805_21120 [Sphaerotilus natans subsp. natans DSM 6575]SIR87858.1 hypothetical protein SAMN05421778_12068 [Sphaerotilus natans]